MSQPLAAPGQFSKRGLFELGARGSRHHLDCRGPRLRGQHAVQDPPGIAAVLGPIGGVDLVVDVVVGVDERDVLLNAGGSYPTLVPLLGAPEPVTTSPPDRSHIQVVAVTSYPYRDRFLRRALPPEWRNLHFFCCSDLRELVA